MGPWAYFSHSYFMSRPFELFRLCGIWLSLTSFKNNEWNVSALCVASQPTLPELFMTSALPQPNTHVWLTDINACTKTDPQYQTDRNPIQRSLFTVDLSVRRDFTGTTDSGNSSHLISVLMHAWPTKDKPSWKGRPPFSQTFREHKRHTDVLM